MTIPGGSECLEDNDFFKSVVVRFEGVLETFVNAVNSFNDNDWNLISRRSLILTLLPTI